MSATLDVSELSNSHISNYIEEQLLNVLFEWNISKNSIVIVYIDNAANIVKAAVHYTFGKDHHLPYFAHILIILSIYFNFFFIFFLNVT